MLLMLVWLQTLLASFRCAFAVEVIKSDLELSRWQQLRSLGAGATHLQAQHVYRSMCNGSVPVPGEGPRRQLLHRNRSRSRFVGLRQDGFGIWQCRHRRNVG